MLVSGKCNGQTGTSKSLKMVPNIFPVMRKRKKGAGSRKLFTSILNLVKRFHQ